MGPKEALKLFLVLCVVSCLLTILTYSQYEHRLSIHQSENDEQDIPKSQTETKQANVNPSKIPPVIEKPVRIETTAAATSNTTNTLTDQGIVDSSTTTKTLETKTPKVPATAINLTGVNESSPAVRIRSQDAVLNHTSKSISSKQPSTDHPLKKHTFPFTPDVLCHGCRHAMLDTRKNYCGGYIKKLMTDQGLDVLAAANQTAIDYPVACFRCNPETCHGEDKYLRFDHAAPRPVKGVTTWLPSVPSEYRLDPSAMENIQTYLSNPDNVYPNKLHLFDYNPSIALLPEKYQIAANGKKAVYLASYRVAHVNMCFETDTRVALYGGSWEVHNKIRRTDYLGLALLDEDLSILKDAVVSTKKDSRRPKLIDGLKKFRNPDLMDYRLFRLHDDIYLSMGITILWMNPSIPSYEKYSPTTNSKSTFGIMRRVVSMEEAMKSPRIYNTLLTATMKSRWSTILEENHTIFVIWNWKHLVESKISPTTI